MHISISGLSNESCVNLQCTNNYHSRGVNSGRVCYQQGDPVRFPYKMLCFSFTCVCPLMGLEVGTLGVNLLAAGEAALVYSPLLVASLCQSEMGVG